MSDKAPKKRGGVKKPNKELKVNPKKAASKKAQNFKVVVALIVPENIEVATETSLWTIARHPDIIARIKVEGNLGSRAKNEAFRQISTVFGDQYTHVLLVHAHTVFGVKDYEALKKADKDIVSGLYVNATVPYLPVYKPLSGNRVDFMPLVREFQKDKPGLMEVSEVGLDFALVKREVIEKCKKQFTKGVDEWFWPERNSSGMLNSETSSFCDAAREKKFKIFLHPGVRIGKITHQAVYLHNFLDYLKEDSTHAKGLLERIESADQKSSKKKSKSKS
ncbi:MAG: hypothetical protein GWP59_03060 [Chlamydiales bacterium]|nr:hypothetical protein [Chlamydiales bacterium]